MRASSPAGLLTIVIAVLALPAAGLDSASRPSGDGQAQPVLRARLTDDVIKQAVRDTLAEQPSRPADTGGVLSGERAASFGRQMDAARKPSCWRPDAMKHQPAQVGPITLVGSLAAPFWAAAILGGECNP